MRKPVMSMHLLIRAMSAFRRWRVLATLLCAASMALAASPAQAHKASDAYLQLGRSGDTLSLRWDIALRDLDVPLDLDANADRELTWGEVKARLGDIQTYALARLLLQRGRCALAEAAAPALENRVDGTYLVLQMRSDCPTTAGAIDIDYHLFGDIDPTHRGLLRVSNPGDEPPTIRSLDPAAGTVSVALPDAGRNGVAAVTTPQTAAGPNAPAAGRFSLFFDGVHHILIGYDHILFLICLVLPSVLRRTPQGWEPLADWRKAVWSMLALVTMFTVGHSITLALASLKMVTLSPRIIEPAIALTIIVTAVDNLRPLLHGRRRQFAFLFGLIHGFGFASVLAELDLPTSGFVAALFQFNLGVEGGQLIIVGVALIVLLTARHWRSYASVVLRGGSCIAIGVAATWFVERVFDLKLLPI